MPTMSGKHRQQQQRPVMDMWLEYIAKLADAGIRSSTKKEQLAFYAGARGVFELIRSARLSDDGQVLIDIADDINAYVGADEPVL